MQAGTVVNPFPEQDGKHVGHATRPNIGHAQRGPRQSPQTSRGDQKRSQHEQNSHVSSYVHVDQRLKIKLTQGSHLTATFYSNFQQDQWNIVQSRIVYTQKSRKSGIDAWRVNISGQRQTDWLHLSQALSVFLAQSRLHKGWKFVPDQFENELSQPCKIPTSKSKMSLPHNAGTNKSTSKRTGAHQAK